MKWKLRIRNENKIGELYFKKKLGHKNYQFAFQGFEGQTRVMQYLTDFSFSFNFSVGKIFIDLAFMGLFFLVVLDVWFDGGLSIASLEDAGLFFCLLGWANVNGF
jgi:hypothetical protein